MYLIEAWKHAYISPFELYEISITTRHQKDWLWMQRVGKQAGGKHPMVFKQEETIRGMLDGTEGDVGIRRKKRNR